MNTGITLIDVREEAMATIKAIKAGNMDLKTASEFRYLLGTVIDTAKVQVEFMKSLPNSMKESMKAEDVKAIAGTLRDRDAELDVTLTQIDHARNNYKP